MVNEEALIWGVPSGSDGLAELQSRSYDLGFVDRRERVQLSDVHLSFTVEGDEQQAKERVREIVERFFAAPDVQELVYAVAAR